MCLLVHIKLAVCDASHLLVLDDPHKLYEYCYVIKKSRL